MWRSDWINRPKEAFYQGQLGDVKRHLETYDAGKTKRGTIQDTTRTKA